MKTYKVRVPRHRLPFFTLSDGGTYLDLLWNYGDPLDVTMGDLSSLMAAVPRADLVIGRRLGKREAREILQQQGENAAEIIGFLFPRDEARWRRARR